jgi:hypothetical protein
MFKSFPEARTHIPYCGLPVSSMWVIMAPACCRKPSLDFSHWRLLSSVISKLSSFFVESRNGKERLVLSITVKSSSPIFPSAFVRTPLCLSSAYHSHRSLFFNIVLHSSISYHTKITVKVVGSHLTSSHHDMGVEILGNFQDSDPVNDHKTDCPY